jgi:hypothetical protein
MDVGVDTHDFQPWHFDEIKFLMTEKAKRLSVHPLTRIRRD